MIKRHMSIPGRISILLLALGCTPASSPDVQDTNDPDDSDSETDGTADCEEVQGEGFGEGQISMNWTLQDVNGTSVNLYDYCGKPVYIEDTTAW